MRFTGARRAVCERNGEKENEGVRRWRTGVYLAQKASNFQRGCKNGVGTRVGIRGPLVGSIKRRLAFLPPTAKGVVLTPLSCFPSFSAFLFYTTGKLSARPLPPLFASLLRRVTLDFFLAFYTPRLPLPYTLLREISPSGCCDPDFAFKRSIFQIYSSLFC